MSGFCSMHKHHDAGCVGCVRSQAADEIQELRLQLNLLAMHRDQAVGEKLRWFGWATGVIGEVEPEAPDGKSYSGDELREMFARALGERRREIQRLHVEIQRLSDANGVRAGESAAMRTAERLALENADLHARIDKTSEELAGMTANRDDLARGNAELFNSLVELRDELASVRIVPETAMATAERNLREYVTLRELSALVSHYLYAAADRFPPSNPDIPVPVELLAKWRDAIGAEARARALFLLPYEGEEEPANDQP